jgi:excisionase family DNA binding protein
VEGNTATAEQSDYLTVEEAARHFRVSAPTIYRRCADGTLPHVRIGTAGPIRISVSELTRVLGSSPAPGNDLAERPAPDSRHVEPPTHGGEAAYEGKQPGGSA